MRRGLSFPPPLLLYHRQYLWGFFLKNLILSLRVYVPLNIFFFLLASQKNMSGIKRVLENIVRSSAFLTTYSVSAVATGCSTSTNEGQHQTYDLMTPVRSGCFIYSNFPWIKMKRPIMMTQAWVAGLATLIEVPSRQSGQFLHQIAAILHQIALTNRSAPILSPELAAYCLPFALETVFRYAQRMQLIEPKPWRTKAVIVLSTAMIIHNLRQQPRILGWLFGVM